MEINAYGPLTREAYQQQSVRREQAQTDDAASSASPPPGAVTIDEKTAKVLELVTAKKGGGNEFTLEDLENLKASGELSEDLKAALNDLIAEVKAADAAAQAKAGAGSGGGISDEISALLDKLRAKTGKEQISVKDLDDFSKSDELNKEEKTAIEELIARLRKAEGEGSSDAANAA